MGLRLLSFASKASVLAEIVSLSDNLRVLSSAEFDLVCDVDSVTTLLVWSWKLVGDASEKCSVLKFVSGTWILCSALAVVGPLPVETNSSSFVAEIILTEIKSTGVPDVACFLIVSASLVSSCLGVFVPTSDLVLSDEVSKSSSPVEELFGSTVVLLKYRY